MRQQNQAMKPQICHFINNLFFFSTFTSNEEQGNAKADAKDTNVIEGKATEEKDKV